MTGQPTTQSLLAGCIRRWCDTQYCSAPRKRAAFILIVMFVMLVPARVASSQDTGVGPVVSGTFSADPDTHWSVAGSVGYSVTPVLSFGVELTWSRLRDPPWDFGPPYYSSTVGHPTRELMSFTTNVRADLHHFGRVVPFVMGGGGVAVDSVAFDVGGASAQPAARIVDATPFLGLVAGGGASVLVTHRVSIEGEGKVLYMRGHRGQWGRVAVGASYRF